MAIIKPISTEYGIEFNYHKISEVHITNENNNRQIKIIVSSYANEEARKEKKAIKKECIISNSTFAMTAFYEVLKNCFPSFAGGEDELTTRYDPVHTEDDVRIVERRLGSNEYSVIKEKKLKNIKDFKEKEEND